MEIELQLGISVLKQKAQSVVEQKSESQTNQILERLRSQLKYSPTKGQENKQQCTT